MNFIKKIREALCMDDASEKDNHILDRSILRQYDIRGIIDETLFPNDVYNIGRAFGTLMFRKNLKTVCVGHDCRLSSSELYSNLIEGLVVSGVEVISIGVCHTPLVYYCVAKDNIDAGIMITGSHNAAQYNGLKIMLGDGQFCGEDIQKLGDMIDNRDFIEAIGREKIVNHILRNYINDIEEDFKFSPEIKVAWDIGNGATSNAVIMLTSRLPGMHHLLFENMDGHFPNRSPDPIKRENIKALCEFVKEYEYDLGVAFDSDGDRLCIVNSKGEPLYSDQTMSVFVKNFLKLNPGAQVIADVKSCDALFDTIKQFGGIGLMEKVGHSFIKARMKSTGALLASELSGHFFFKDRWYGFDDGIYAALRAIEIICENKTAFDDVHSGIVTPEIRITCDEDKKEEIIKNVRMQLEKYNVFFVAIDGVRVTSEQGWWILRSSNTENSLSLRIEAYSIEHMQELMNNVVGYLQEHIHNIREIIDLQYNKDEDV